MTDDVAMTDEDIEQEIQDIVEDTRLSRREAEVYVYTEEVGLSQRETAEILGVSQGNVAKTRNGQIREKIEEAERTAELNLS